MRTNLDWSGVSGDSCRIKRSPTAKLPRARDVDCWALKDCVTRRLFIGVSSTHIFGQNQAPDLTPRARAPNRPMDGAGLCVVLRRERAGLPGNPACVVRLAGSRPGLPIYGPPP